MAQRAPLYDTGTPQRALQNAALKRYKAMRPFFDAVAAEAQVTTGAAKGTFYDFLRAGRPLPDDQRKAYLKLLQVKASTLDEIEDLRPKAMPRGRVRLEELADTVGDLLERQEKTERRLATLRARVRKLEVQPSDGGAAATRPQKVGRS